MKTLVVIPAYNEEHSLPLLISEIQKMGLDYVIVNDGSTDQTEQICQSNRFNHLNLTNNIGLAGVTQMGFMYARDNDYDAAVVIDGDGQHRPEYISTIVDSIKNGADYVIGSRFIEKAKPWDMRMLGSRILSLCIRLKTGKQITDPTSGMRGLSKKLIMEFAEHMNFIAEPDACVYVIRHGYQYQEIPVKMNERENGSSYFRNPFKSGAFMFNVIMSILFIQW